MRDKDESEPGDGASAVRWPGLEVRPAETSRWDLLSLGEVMLRFDPGEGRISSARRFDVWEGGGEYNVARGLRRCFRLHTGIVTRLVDNPVGRLVEELILQSGVDTTHVHWVPSDGIGQSLRNGLYFLERGFGVRAGLGMMDRGHTAITQIQPGQIDWEALFQGQGARWFHTGGIMAALSESATETVREAMAAARRAGAVVSFDCNYRPSLWRERGGRAGAVEVNRSLMPMVDVLFGHEGDLAKSLGEAAKGPVWHTAESFGGMAERVHAEFPTLKVIASTLRVPKTATRNQWSAFGYAGGAVYTGLQFADLEVLDRVGGGDSFAAGVIFGLLSGKGLQWALDCGVAHGALCMTTPGDASQATLAEVERLMAGDLAGTHR